MESQTQKTQVSTTPRPLIGPVITSTISYDQGDTNGTMNLMIKCSNAPLGSQVCFWCSTPGPVPPINLPWTVVDNTNVFLAGMYTDVPANFSEPVSYAFGANGYPVSSQMLIEIIALIIITPTDKRYDQATSLEELGLSKEGIEQLIREKEYDVALGPLKGIVMRSEYLHLPTVSPAPVWT